VSSAKIEIELGEDSQYYFRVVAANGEIISVSEGYTTSEDAKRGAGTLVRTILEIAAIAADAVPHSFIVNATGELPTP
jgi:uncharacterized protein YegP (UPF0339 family)